MIKYRTETKTVKEKILESIICDVCKELIKDIMEQEEVYHMRFTGGYASIFGDMNNVEVDICQHCLKKLLGEYMRINE